MGTKTKLKMRDGDRVMGLFRKGLRDDPRGLETVHIICSEYLKKDDKYATKKREAFIRAAAIVLPLQAGR